jgi:hypothetical protein
VATPGGDAEESRGGAPVCYISYGFEDGQAARNAPKPEWLINTLGIDYLDSPDFVRVPASGLTFSGHKEMRRLWFDGTEFHR